MKTFFLIACLLFTGCASIPAPVVKVAQSTDTFALCKTADVATTAYGIHTGFFVEKNPLMAPLMSQGWFPVAAVSAGIVYLIYRWNNPAATAGANVVTCSVAAHNFFMLAK